MKTIRVVLAAALNLVAYAFVLVLVVLLVSRGSLPDWRASWLPGLLVGVLVAGFLIAVYTCLSAWRAALRADRAADPDRGWWGVMAWPLLVSALVLLGLQTWFVAPGGGARANEPAPQERHYAAIIDAGSSGSRIAIFEWRRAGNGDPHVWPVVSVEDKDAVGKDCPISDLPKERDRICGCLRQVTETGRDQAMRYLGEPHLAPMALRVKATAGVRFLDAASQVDVLRETDRCLGKSAQYDNSGHYAWRGAEVISGAEEGLYAWLAVNHVARTLRNDAAATFGIVEVGGKSAQIAFRVPGRISPAPTHGEILAVPLESETLHIYALSSTLGRKTAYDGIDKAGQDNCSLNGDVTKCLAAINAYLCKVGLASEACRDRKPEFVPPRDLRFAGLSNFTYVAHNMGLGGLALDTVRARAETICGSPHDEGRRDEFLKPAGLYKSGVCFDALYLTQLARDGWGVPLKAVTPPDPQWASNPSWPLGAMIFEALRADRTVR